MGSWSDSVRGAASDAKTPKELYDAINMPLPRYHEKGGPLPRNWRRRGLPLSEIVEANTKRETEPAVEDGRVLYAHARQTAIRLRESQPGLPPLPATETDPFLGLQTIQEWCIDKATPRLRNVVVAVALTVGVIGPLEIVIHATTWSGAAWVKAHPHSLALQTGFGIVVLLAFLGGFVQPWRKSCWATGIIGVLLVLLGII